MSRRTPEIEVYKGKGGKYRWRLIAGNGENIANGSQGYHNRSNALRAFRRCGMIFKYELYRIKK